MEDEELFVSVNINKESLVFSDGGVFDFTSFHLNNQMSREEIIKELTYEPGLTVVFED